MYCREFLERVGAGQRLDGGAEAAFEELAGGQLTKPRQESQAIAEVCCLLMQAAHYVEICNLLLENDLYREFE
jgi:hypothetical protein